MVFRGYGLSLRSKPRCINIYLSSSCLPEPFTLLSLFDISIYQFCILPRACWGNSRNWHFPGISRDVIIRYFDDTALHTALTNDSQESHGWSFQPDDVGTEAVLVTEELTLVGKGFIAGGGLNRQVFGEQAAETQVSASCSVKILAHCTNAHTEDSTVEKSTASKSHSAKWRGCWRDMMYAACSSLPGTLSHHTGPATSWTFLQSIIVRCNVLASGCLSHIFHKIVLLITF